jgi:hypothetical protein
MAENLFNRDIHRLLKSKIVEIFLSTEFMHISTAPITITALCIKEKEVSP